MQELNAFLSLIDGYIGGSQWFVFALLGTGIFFTFYLGFPQFRYFGQAVRIVQGKYDRTGDRGDASHFQALATALSGTVGTGNIAGVAFAIHLGGPSALFWMLVTAFFGMTTKFVEVTLSHKYREVAKDGSIAGGPMYYMKNRLNNKWMAGLFALATVLSSFGSGNMPQINSIASSVYATFGIAPVTTGALLSVLLAVVILGGIHRIVKVTEKIVPVMAIVYFLGCMSVILYNIEQVPAAIWAIFSDVFSGTAATGGFLGASVAYAFNRGVNRGLFSNEAGQGSAPIAHAAARAHEPVSEGMVSILEPFIDTILICSLTGLALLSSGVWNEKIDNRFQAADVQVLSGAYSDQDSVQRFALGSHLNGVSPLPLYTGDLSVVDGKLQARDVTILHARSMAEDVRVLDNGQPYSGLVKVLDGKLSSSAGIYLQGKSLVHSAPLTIEALKRSYLGGWGQYIVSISLLLFAFSTAISWSYYGDRAMTFLFGTSSVLYYRLFYVGAFFLASFTDTAIIWTLAGITVALMTLPNLLGILWLHKEMKQSVADYWKEFKGQ